MTQTLDTKQESFLFRLRRTDTPTGISANTFACLMEATGLSKTELAHYALRLLANKTLRNYDDDDGPLTDIQIATIRDMSPIKNINESDFNEKLFS